MPMDPLEVENAERRQRYDAYIKEREALRKDSLTVSERYDKAILLLGGGALALSVTFLEKIAPHPTPISLLALAIAWLGLITSIVLQLHALSKSQTVTNDEMEIADREYRDYLVAIGDLQPLPNEIPVAVLRVDAEERKTSTRRLNVWSRWLLTLSIFLLCLFSLVNLPFRDNPLNRVEAERTEHKSRYRYRKETIDIMAHEPLNESKGSYIAPKNALPPPSLAKPAPSPTPTQAPAQNSPSPTPPPPAAPPQNP